MSKQKKIIQNLSIFISFKTSRVLCTTTTRLIKKQQFFFYDCHLDEAEKILIVCIIIRRGKISLGV